MVAFDKTIRLQVRGIAEHYCDSQRVTKTDQGSREVTALGSSYRSWVSRSNVIEEGNPCSANVCATASRAVSALKSVRIW